MQKPFDFVVFIGRFQPFHQGHLAVLETALEQASQVIVLLGSALQPRTFRNPWTWQEREQMLRACLAQELQDRVRVLPLQDMPYQQTRWVTQVQQRVQQLVARNHSASRPARIGLVGHQLNQSHYYPRWFPQWQALGVPHRDGISGTAIREHYFAGAPVAADQLPAPVLAWLQRFAASDAFAELKAELEFIAQYKHSWASAPYDVNFVTVDALVVQAGHILLVERNGRPGKGLLALPGGFLDTHERIRDACLRELKEETDFPLELLQSALQGSAVFDEPYRSARGRTITHAFHFELPPGPERPAVKAGDDARHVHWVPLAQLAPERLFEDHYFIIQKMLGL